MDFYSAAKKVFGFQDKDFKAITKLPQGFCNDTYGNDTCPSIFHDISVNRGYYVKIYIDYEDVEDREIQNTKRYMFSVITPENEYILLSDDWKEVLKLSPIAVKICDLFYQGERNKAKTLISKYEFECI